MEGGPESLRSFGRFFRQINRCANKRRASHVKAGMDSRFRMTRVDSGRRVVLVG
jgi:hypothetical protein